MQAQGGSTAGPKGNIVEQATASAQDTAKAIHYATHSVIPQEWYAFRLGSVSLVAIGMALLILIAALLARWGALWAFARLAQAGGDGRDLRHQLRVLARRMLSFAILLTGLFFALSVIAWPERPVDWQLHVWRAYATLVICAVGLLAYSAGEALFAYLTGPSRTHAALVDKQLTPLLRDILRVALIVVVVVALLENWGYNPIALLAGVGLGGLAIAFAAQDSIANVFGSMVIHTDQPFRVGDWVRIGEAQGIIEEIGIRSTRIRAFDQSVVSVPNKSVTTENIQNFSAMRQRRIRLLFRLRYGTGADKVEEVLVAIRELIAQDGRIVQRGPIVNLEEFAPTGILVQVYCFADTADWAESLAIRDALMLSIMRRMEDAGVEFANVGVAAADK